MQGILKRLNRLILISLSLISVSGLVMAQEASTAIDPSTVLDPCWLLAYPPDSPIDDSLNAGMEHKALQLAATGENDTALALLSRLIEASPDDASLYALRGCLYTRTDEQAAVDDWATFIDLSDDDTQIAEVEKLIAIYSEDEIACHSRAHYETQREARDLINGYDPMASNQERNNLRGLAYLCLGYYDLAVREFDIALNIYKNNDALYNNRALAYSALGDYEKALSDYNRSLELKPNDATTLANRGRNYIRMGKYGAALADYDRSLEIEQNNPNRLYWRAYLYYSIEGYEECVVDYTHLFVIDIESRESPVDLMRRGTCYDNLGQMDEAARDYNQAAELEPQESVALVYRGVAFRALGQYSDALTAFNGSIELNDAYDYPWLQRGLVYYEQEEYQQALDDYNKAVDLNPARALTYLHRAYLYYKLEDYDHAREDFETYLEMIPDTRRREEIEDLLADMADV